MATASNIDFTPDTSTIDFQPDAPAVDFQPDNALNLSDYDAATLVPQPSGDLGIKQREAELEKAGYGHLTPLEDQPMERARAAMLTPEEMGAFMPQGLAKVASPIENAAAGVAGGFSDPANLIWMGGGAKAGKVLGDAFMAQMGTGAATSTAEGVNKIRQGDTQGGIKDITTGVLSAVLPALHARGLFPKATPSTEEATQNVPRGTIPPEAPAVQSESELPPSPPAVSTPEGFTPPPPVNSVGQAAPQLDDLAELLKAKEQPMSISSPSNEEAKSDMPVDFTPDEPQPRDDISNSDASEPQETPNEQDLQIEGRRSASNPNASSIRPMDSESQTQEERQINEQVQPISEQTGEATGRDQPEGSGGVHREGEVGSEEVSSEGNSGTPQKQPVNPRNFSKVFDASSDDHQNILDEMGYRYDEDNGRLYMTDRDNKPLYLTGQQLKEAKTEFLQKIHDKATQNASPQSATPTESTSQPLSDFDRFEQLKQQVGEAVGSGKFPPPEVLREMEDIKNRQPNKGYPPEKPVDQPVNKPAETPDLGPSMGAKTTGDVGEVHGFGGKVKPNAKQGAATPEELTKLQQVMTPGLDAVSGTKQGIQSLLAPTTKSPEHLEAAEALGAKLGAMNRRQEASSAALHQASKLFDRLGVHNEKLEPSKNPGIKFMSDMSQGRPLAERFQKIAADVQKQFDSRLEKLKEAGAALQTVRENYFPGMWTRESRLAFNAAMEKAKKDGRLPDDFNVNDATPEQKAAIKADVDRFLEQGKGSDKDMLSYLTRTPMKGKESFRKQKVFDDIMTGAEFGLRPISNNPIDLVKGKLAEMDKSIMANEFFQDRKAAGKLKIISPYEEVPEGWQKLNDKYGTIYGAPTVTIPEHVDKAVYEGLLEAADKIGVKHERSMKFPPGPGNRALGLSYQGQNFVRTKFATETSVLAHEIGHQIDHKYDLWQQITGGEKGNERKSQVQKELRAIADMTGRPTAYTRTQPEKIAQMVEAYVHAPDRMMQEAPYIFNKFENFLKSKPELAGITNIRPGLELTKLTGEKYVGLPIMGYRVVPDATGDVVNNYLSSSLYNNKYFGGLYKGWMASANALNQSQLGMGSAFHAGFTTGDVQVSAGANLLKDVYGVARGNRSLSDLGRTASNWAVSSFKTAMQGDKVLNAWRNPDATIDPQIAKVVKAAELAGGGFKMEKGLQTEQGKQMVRDWYADHPIKAALRSPIALTEAMAQPIMSYLVPRQKAGVFSELASRIIDQNPDKSLEELTPEFRQAWNRVDARLGQVRHNRLFVNNTAKNLVQGVVRAPGWTGGTIAEIGGALPDLYNFFKEWKDTGKAPQNIPDRVAYTASLLVTMGAINGALSYAFTGQQPVGMDYLAFRTGRKDKDGNDERFLLPSYVKDMLAYWERPGTTLLNKTHPLINMMQDVARNRDYYGYEIRNPNANGAAQAGQVAKYVVKDFTPFWLRGEQQMPAKEGTAARVAPIVGVMPAPAYVDRSAMQNRISELYHERTGERTKPYESRDADEAKRAAHDSSTMDVYMFKRLPLSDKQALAAKMTPQEKSRYGVK